MLDKKRIANRFGEGTRPGKGHPGVGVQSNLQSQSGTGSAPYLCQAPAPAPSACPWLLIDLSPHHELPNQFPFGRFISCRIRHRGFATVIRKHGRFCAVLYARIGYAPMSHTSFRTNESLSGACTNGPGLQRVLMGIGSSNELLLICKCWRGWRYC